MPDVGAGPSADVVIRAYEGQDEARVLELLQGGFGTWPGDSADVEPSEFFRWKHLANPFGGSLLLVAEADGELIGFAAWLRWRLASGDRTYEALRGVDFVVAPEHRGRGVPVAMIRTASERFPADVALTFSRPNERSRSGAVKSGRHRVGVLRDFVRPRRPLRGVLRGSLGWGRSITEEPKVEAAPSARLLEDGAAVSSLLAGMEAPIDRLVTARDLDYLRWRYGSFADYRAVRCDADGGLAGIAIFRLRRRRSALVALVCELITTPGDRRVAQRLLRLVRQAVRTDFVTCAFPSRREAARCGFVQSPGGCLLVAHPLREDLRPDPTQLASWGLSVGDLELL